ARSGRMERVRDVANVHMSDQWIEYGMPEPYAHDRRTWIDGSTDPISVWYVDASPLPPPACGGGFGWGRAHGPGLKHGGGLGLACPPPLPDSLPTRAPRCSPNGSRCRPTTRCGSGWMGRFQSFSHPTLRSAARTPSTFPSWDRSGRSCPPS